MLKWYIKWRLWYKICNCYDSVCYNQFRLLLKWSVFPKKIKNPRVLTVDRYDIIVNRYYQMYCWNTRKKKYIDSRIVIKYCFSPLLTVYLMVVGVRGRESQCLEIFLAFPTGSLAKQRVRQTVEDYCRFIYTSVYIYSYKILYIVIRIIIILSSPSVGKFYDRIRPSCVCVAGIWWAYRNTTTMW